MELRSDIATAAVRMTSRYDVNREIRQLGAYLREGESVQRITAGVYGTGTGLLAVTNHRVLLLRDGRSGQASEGFPLERLSTAEWMADGVRGTIIISDSNSVAELHDVTLADGEEIVGFVRALMNAAHPQRDGGRWSDEARSNTAPSIPVVRAGAGTAAGLAGQGTGYGRPYAPPAQSQGMPMPQGGHPTQGTPPWGVPTQGVPGQGAPGQGAPAQGIPGQGIPGQGVPAQGMPGQGAPAQGMPGQGVPGQGIPGQGAPVQGVPAHPSAPVTPGSTADALARGAVPVTLLSGSGPVPAPQAPVDAPLDADQAANAAAGTTAMSSVPTAGPTTAMPSVPTEGTTTALPPVGPLIGATGTTPVGALTGTTVAPAGNTPVGATGTPVSAAVNSAVSIPTPVTELANSQNPVGQPGSAIGSDPANAGLTRQTGATATTPVVSQPANGANPNNQTVLIGEVPVSQLAAEESGGAPATTGDADATTATATTEGERPEPISWRMPHKGSAASTTASTVAITRTDKEPRVSRPSGRSDSTRPEGSGKPSGRSKWIWLGAGAAGLIALAAVGSAKLISPQHQPGAVPVNPTPAVVDQATGPVATVARVIDGDTIEVTGPEVSGVVEVLGIVAPRADRNQCGAATSKAYAIRMLNNTQVTLVSDPSQPATNKAGHKQAFVKLNNGSDYSVMAAGAGMARYYDSPQPVASADEIKAAESQAQAKREGVWGPPCNAKPAPQISGASTSSNTGNTSTANQSGNQPG